jgi:cytochrome P450
VKAAANTPGFMIELLSPVRRLGKRKAKRARREIEQVLRKVIDDHRKHPDQHDDMLSMPDAFAR